MSDENPTKPRKANLVQQPRWTLQSVDGDGCFAIARDGKHVRMYGQATELVPTSRHPVTGKKRWFRKPISTTRGYQPNAALDTTLIVTRSESGALVRITGRVQSEDRSQSLGTVAAPREDTCSVAHDLGRPTSQPSDPVSAGSRKKRSKRDFKLELEAVAALRAAAFDPDLRMWFITVYVGESAASLYRKMGITFPRPVKRDKGSFWPMSIIDAYKAGMPLNPAPVHMDTRSS
jgi:predicted DNA-binding transcriptional regulator AlpA